MFYVLYIIAAFCNATGTVGNARTAGIAPSMARIAILAASLVNRAQLAASLAALFWQYQLDAFFAVLLL